MKTKRCWFFYITTFIVTFLLIACGGGSDDDSVILGEHHTNAELEQNQPETKPNLTLEHSVSNTDEDGSYIVPVEASFTVSALEEQSDGSHKDVSEEVTWLADGVEILPIDAPINGEESTNFNIDEKGRLKGKSQGKANITAQLGDTVSEPLKVKVMDIQLSELILSSDDRLHENTHIGVGHDSQLTVEGVFSDGSRLNVSPLLSGDFLNKALFR